MSYGDIHSELNGGCEVQSEVCWNDASRRSSSKGHEICMFSIFLYFFSSWYGRRDSSQVIGIQHSLANLVSSWRATMTGHR